MKIEKRWFFSLVLTSVFFISCNKVDRLIGPLNPFIKYGSITDSDGNAYKTIQIGTQTWMERNLKTTKYNDGTSIPSVTDVASWSSISTPAFCWQLNDEAYRVTYGLLYNWYAVSTGKLCPAGWHVPSDTEWATLFSFVGGSDIAGGILKEKGTLHWFSPNTGATDIYGFRALPGGTRLDGSDAIFDNLFEMGFWWTSTSSSETHATYRVMNDNSSSVQKYFCDKNRGMSVRCIMDL